MSERAYQTAAKSAIAERFKTEREVVLGACPSSGKTTMAIDIIKNTVENNPTARVLILAHATNILKTQWGDRLKNTGLSASPNLDSQVVYNIPQALRLKNLPHFDLIVVDEGHEYVFVNSTTEGMVSRIIKHGDRILYLTGTPSKFIREGYKPIVIPASDLIPEYVSDLYLGLASTTANLRHHYNRIGNLSPAGQAEMTKTVRADLDALLGAIVKRLSGVFKTSPLLKTAAGWLPVIKRLPKTMVACESIDQAIRATNYFKKENIKVLLSHSDRNREVGFDIDSQNIERFRKDVSIKILVVVGRGILGFDMPDLVNVVDMTGSRNIDRVYQLYARVMRKDPAAPNRQKFFFKVVPAGERDLFKFYMTAALMLMKKDFIERYNGRNLNSMEVAVKRTRNERERSDKRSPNNQRENRKVAIQPIDEFFEAEVMAHTLLTDVWSKAGRCFDEYATATLQEVKERLGYTNRLTPEDYHALAARMTEEWRARQEEA